MEVSIYRDAITALLNLGEPKPVEVLDGDLVVGRQPMLLLDEQTSIAITALHEDSGSMAQQLGRLLQHTRLAAIHWLNFNRTTLEVSKISKP